MRLLLALAACLLATTAAAHESWLRPAAAPATVGRPAAVGFTSGMAFPTPDTGPRPARLDSAITLQEDDTVPLEITSPGPGELLFAFTPTRPGLAVAAVTLKPQDIAMGAAEVPEYFQEADPPPAVRDAWTAIAAQGEWREVYVKAAKAIVCVAPCADSRTAMRPSGQPVEFIALDPGPSPRRFKLIRNVTLFIPGQTVRLFPAGKAARVLKTDAAGIVEIPADVAGEVMLSTVFLEAPAADGKFHSVFASIVVGR
ncbi:MAG: hypothetical protein Q7T61_05475 [Caulobacter sp.]|nr:hypothetical protein [Caulobacter sp.]